MICSKGITVQFDILISEQSDLAYWFKVVLPELEKYGAGRLYKTSYLF